jgi:hypothetical protein
MVMRKIVLPSGATAQSPAGDTPRHALGLEGFIVQLDRATGDGRMQKVKQMLKAGRFVLFSKVSSDHVTGVVSSQAMPSVVYVCKIDEDGRYMCCTQNLLVCGGMRGKPCKHLLLLMVSLVKIGAADATVLAGWARKAAGKRPVLDKDAMSATLIEHEDAVAREMGRSPTEPER